MAGSAGERLNLDGSLDIEYEFPWRTGWREVTNAMDTYHVVPTEAGWQLQKEGSERPLIDGGSKATLLKELQFFMNGREGTVKIHTRTGEIEEERTYPRRADPRQSKG